MPFSFLFRSAPPCLVRTALNRTVWGVPGTLRFLSLLALGLAFAWSGALCVHAQTAVAPTVGDGLSLASAYQIGEIGHLVWLGEQAAANKTAGRYYQMANNIAASDTATWNDTGTTTDTLEGFRPIGTYSSPDTTSFRGFFDGNGKKISGLTINRPATEYIGLFGYVGTGGEVQNLTLEQGSVTGVARVGALAGGNNGWLLGCVSNATVVAQGEYAGGLVGGNVLGGRVTNGMSFGSVTGEGKVGGISGSNSASTIEYCFATGTITGSGAYVGGILGDNSGTLSECYATGIVKGQDGVGGLLGYNHTSVATKVLNCFATGPASGRDKIGGLVGTTGGAITNCFATGAVTASGASKGGLVGANTGTLTACYWDRETTGQTASPGSAASFGKTTAEMKQLATFQPGGGTGPTDWDFASIWGIDEGKGYPYFRTTPPPFRLSATVEGSGSFSLDPTGTPIYVPGRPVAYPPGTVVSLTATPAPRYRFTGWTGPVADPTTASTTVLMDTHRSVTAYFELNEYQLTTEVQNGLVMKSPDQTTYTYGTVVTLTATPDPRYRFTGWTGPVADPTTASTTVLMDAHKSVTAHFELNEYKLTVEATSGSVTLSPDQTTYTYGTVVTLTATPDTGYRFIEWTGGDVADPTAASTTLIVTGDTTVTARFLRSYEIRTLEELQAIATGDLTGYYTLMNDIDASVTATWNDAGTTTDTIEGFRPIGGGYSNPDTTSFRGVFDGNGKKIMGLTINRPDTRCVGFFEAVGVGGEIRDLTLAGGMVAGGSGAGALVGANTQGLISNCHSSSKVSAKSGSVGGLLGSNEKGFVRNCSTSETAVGEDPASVGGLIGWNSGSVVDSVATGAVKVMNTTRGSLMFKGMGGLVGANSGGTIVNSFSTGPVEGVGQYYIVGGGLAGTNNGSIRNSFASSSVKGRTKNGSSGLPTLGGLVGLNTGGTVTNSFALGAIEGTFNSYPPYLGGLIGQLNGGSVSNCFSIGGVADFGTYTGGLIGRVSAGTVTACYWDKDTSDQSASAGGTGAIGKYTAAMKRQATFQPGGGTGADDWDFVSVWGIVEGQTYPYLRSTSEPPLLRLDVSVVGPGSVTLDPPGGAYAPGTTVTLTATAEAGSHLAEWTGTVADREAEVTTIFLDTHKNVTARFLPSHEIRTLEELQAIATGDLAGYYILMNDIDASATATWNDEGTTEGLLQGFRPIGSPSSTTPDTTSFRGIFDGNGKKISGLTINRPTTDYIGLFGYVWDGGEVRNLTLEGGNITGKNYVGGIVGVSTAPCRVTGCASTNTVKGLECVGGMVGLNLGRVINGTASGMVTGSRYYAPVGGLIGENSGGTVTHCSASGQIKDGGYAGGLVGRNRYRGTISDCFASGSVIGCLAGGLVGRNGEYNGGIPPDQSVIRNCFATGTVTGIDSSGVMGVWTGGLVGSTNAGSIENCFATGAVMGQGYMTRLGGLVGSNYGGAILNSFAAGRVTRANSTDAVGGLIGFHSNINSETPAALTACYWDVEATGLTTSAGGTGVVGKTTAEMKRQATFQPGGGTGATDWDFTSVWGIVEGQSYPYLGPSSAPPSFRLDVLVEGNGSVTLDPPGGLYAAGTLVNLTAVPDTGSHFVEWTSPVADPRSDSFTVTIDTHKSVAVRFLPCHEIRTLEELQAVATGDLTEYYILMNDIDASPTATWNDAGTTTDTLEGFRPIGTYSSPDTTSFRGVFDGNGKKITGLTINRPGGTSVGLFAIMGMKGEVRNLTLEGGRIEGRSSVGTVVGANKGGTLFRCSVSVPVTGVLNVGNVAGYNAGAVTQCSTIGGGVRLRTTTETLTSTPVGGGLVGLNGGIITQSFSRADIVSDGVSGGYYPHIGGLVGINIRSITDSFATGTVIGQNCGGLIGANSGSVANCFAAGQVTGTSESVGGLIGSSTTTATACYWDVETTSQTTSAGGGVGKTTAEMKQLITFQPGGGTGANDWNFSTVWGIVEGETYPFLRFAPPSFGLNITVEGEGSVALNPAGGIYPWGSQVTLTARPGAGSRFVRWTGDVPSGGAGRNPLKITILKDTSLTVRFEPAGPQPAVWMIH